MVQRVLKFIRTYFALPSLMMVFLLASSGWAKKITTATPCKGNLIEATRPLVISGNDMTMTWFSPLQMGDEVRELISKLKPTAGPATGDRDYAGIIFVKDAQENKKAYYATMVRDMGGPDDEMKLILHPLENGAGIQAELAKHMQLVWDTYLKEKTVTQEEIEDFKRLEAELIPQRKISFVVTETKTGQTLAFMRFYDGSPFPAMFFGNLGLQLDFDHTDPRVPIERRYPEHNFREETEYIYEAGRLAKGEGITSALDKQFEMLAGFLHKKYGFLGHGPKEYLKGKIIIEITSRNLEKFSKPRDQGGYGFKMEYLPAKDKDGQKYVLSCSIFDFVSNFFTPMTAVDLATGRQLHPRELR